VIGAYKVYFFVVREQRNRVHLRRDERRRGARRHLGLQCRQPHGLQLRPYARRRSHARGLEVGRLQVRTKAAPLMRTSFVVGHNCLGGHVCPR